MFKSESYAGGKVDKLEVPSDIVSIDSGFFKISFFHFLPQDGQTLCGSFLAPQCGQFISLGKDRVVLPLRLPVRALVCFFFGTGGISRSILS